MTEGRGAAYRSGRPVRDVRRMRTMGVCAEQVNADGAAHCAHVRAGVQRILVRNESRVPAWVDARSELPDVWGSGVVVDGAVGGIGGAFDRAMCTGGAGNKR